MEVTIHRPSERDLAHLTPTVFVAAVSPMNEDGYSCMSLDLEHSLECLETADTVIFEVIRHRRAEGSYCQTESRKSHRDS